MSLLKKMKAAPALRDIPIIMATAKGAEYDKIQSLDLGADDYLVKPFGVMEMVSRVKAVLRRCHPADTGHVLSAGGLSMDLDCRTVTADGQRLQLTYKEFELLRLFLSHPGMAFTREQLFTQVWNMEYMDDSGHPLDMHIRIPAAEVRGLRQADRDRSERGLPHGDRPMTGKIFRSTLARH